MTEKKVTFVEKVIDFLKGGEEAKVKKFQASTVKYLKKQVKELKDENETHAEKLEDAKEELVEASLNVDLDRIKSTDDRNSYIEHTYVDVLDSKYANIDSIEKSVEANNKLVVLREKQIELLS